MSRRFTFRLQPVLDQRARIEEREQLRVAEIEIQRISVESTLRQIQSDLVEAREEMRGQLRAGDAASGLSGVRLQANASLHHTLKAQRAAIELAGVLSRLDVARKDLLKAAADRKAVQMLKDKRFAEHRAMLYKREATDLDELAVMRHGRSNGPMAFGSDSPAGDQDS